MANPAIIAGVLSRVSSGTKDEVKNRLPNVQTPGPEGPGPKCLEKRPSQEPSRRVRHDRGAANRPSTAKGVFEYQDSGPNTFLCAENQARESRSEMNKHKYFQSSSLQSSNRCAHLPESHRTLRDGSFGWRCPRHFVPGYDRTVPSGRRVPS
jgi:hypothetical protein